MIYFIASQQHQYTIDVFLGARAKQLSVEIRPISYQQLFGMRKIPAGTYVFSDIERLTASGQEHAAALWGDLAAAGLGLKLLNHPLTAMRRYELLRALRETGINGFDVYRLTEARRPARFPVFVRGENDHAGSQTGLLATQQELDRAVEALIAEGKSRDGRIITEFHAEQDQHGLYRKYSAFNVGGRIIPRHMFCGRTWVVKSPQVIDERIAREELDYVETNPHESTLKDVFELSRIDFGRVDYGIIDGRIQVYEINTNPVMIGRGNIGGALRSAAHEHFARGFVSAIDALDSRRPPGPEIAVSAPPTQSGAAAAARRESGLRSLLRVTGLSRYELDARVKLGRWRRRLRSLGQRDRGRR